MVEDLEPARWRDVIVIRAGFEEEAFWHDVAGEWTKGFDMVPVVLELQHSLLLQSDVHFAEGHSPSKVLDIQGPKAGGVQFFAEEHCVDLVTVHQVDHRELSGKPVHS
jgi:hypothetical protein